MSNQSGRGQVYLALQPSEMAVFRAASEIYAAYVATGKVDAGNEQTYIQKAIREAVLIAQYVEHNVQSDEETIRKTFQA